MIRSIAERSTIRSLITGVALERQGSTVMMEGVARDIPLPRGYGSPDITINEVTGVELIGANRAGLFIHLMPVFGSLMAISFLGEVFLWYHAVGIALIAAGIYLATRRRGA